MSPRAWGWVLVLGLGVAPAAGFAQGARTELAGATAIVGGRPEVRLRVRMELGWVPAQGIRIYREAGGRRELLAERHPSDATADRVLDPALRGKALWTRAGARMTSDRALDFRALRPPSAAARFRQLKTASDALIQLRQQPATDAATRTAIQQNLGTLATLRAQPPVRLAAGTAGTALRTALPALAGSDREVFAARGRLMLSALVKSAVAESLGLGARDRGVRAGDRVRYTVAAVPARGGVEQVLDSLVVVVGADPQPPAPEGIESQQLVDDDGDATGTVALRWSRLDAALETALLNAAYVLERREAPPARVSIGGRLGAAPTLGTRPGASADTVWRRIHEKPVMIAAINGDEEPLSFFEDELEEPGAYEYRVALVDGFGRQSAWTEHALRVVDWRRPAAPTGVAATLDEAPRDAAGVKQPPVRTRVMLGFGRASGMPKDLGAWSASAFTLAGKAAVQVSWSRVDAPAGLATRYRVYRIDREAANPQPVLLTPEPIEAAELPATAEQDSARVRLATLERTASSGAALRAATLAARGPMLAARAEVVRLRSIARPRLGYVDAGASLDRHYEYVVRAAYVPSGLESGDSPAAAVAVPSPARPPVVGGGAFAGFAVSDGLASSQLLADTTGRSRLRAFTALRQGRPRLVPAPAAYRAVAGAAPAFTTSKTIKAPAPRTEAPAAPAAGLPALREPPDLARPILSPRAPVFAKTDLSKLRLNLVRSRDDGGVVTLRWTRVAGFKDATYKIERRFGDLDWVAVGTTRPNAESFRDVLPRSMARTYTYRVTAISRWGVAGQPSAPITAAVPSTVRPGTPNLLSVAPDRTADRALRLRIDPNPADESVSAYRVFRDGAAIGTVAGADGGELTYLDTGLAAGRSYRYHVVAETGAGLKSGASRALAATATKLGTAAPAGLQAAADAGGVRLTWTAAPDAASYCVQRRSAPGAVPQVLAGAVRGALAYLDVTAMAGRTYVYEVVATDAAGNLSPAAAATVTLP